MSSINTNVVVITARLTHDPELHETSGDSVYAILPVAINRGDALEPIYYDVKVWNGRGRACVDYRRKGDLVAVTGELDQYKRPGSDNPWNYITAESVEFLPSGRKNGSTE